MTIAETPPIACTLAPAAFKDRLAWISALNRDALRRHERRDLRLHLRYAPEARDRVREMVRNEQACCAFLSFDLREQPGEISLTITAPEAARESVDLLFEPFLAGASEQPASGSRAGFEALTTPLGADKQVGTKAAGIAAMTLATGAVVCGACCVLPFAVPAVVLASTGTILAWFAAAHAWVTGLAILAVAGAWGWIAWQTVQTRRRPARSTLYVMAGATALMVVAVLWPLIESRLLASLVLYARSSTFYGTR